MKKAFLFFGAIAICACTVFAQDKEKTDEDEGYKFDTVKVLPITSVKNQNNAGTCWCYSGLAFIESELLRMGKGEYDLSEMYIVANTYNDRAAAAVRTHGDVSFSQGGAFNDVIYGMKTFGLVPEEVMRPGAMYGDTLSNHTELSAITDAIVNAIAKNEKLKKLQSGTDGGWRSKYLLSERRSVSADNMVTVSDDVLFWSSEGVTCLSGSKLQCVWRGAMEPLSRQTRQLPRFDDILGAIFTPAEASAIGEALTSAEGHGRLRSEGESLHCRLNARYAMVYSMREQLWGGMLLGDAVSSHDGYIPVLALTRPLHLGDGHEHKRVRAWWCCGLYGGSTTAGGSLLRMAVWGSNDLQHWHLVGTSGSHYLTGLAGSGYRHYRVLVAGWMREEERMKGVLLEVRGSLRGKR